MSEDVKKVMQEFGQAFEEFKKANDEKLENLEKGVSDAMLDEKIAKIEAGRTRNPKRNLKPYLSQ